MRSLTVCAVNILDFNCLITWSQSFTYICLLAQNQQHSSRLLIFELWWTFSVVDFFRSTNANWRGWPRSGRSCVPVWTIFQEDATTLQTDVSPPDQIPKPSCYWNISTCLFRYLISDIAIVICSWFWKVSVSPCMASWSSHSVFSSLFICPAFINRDMSSKL